MKVITLRGTTNRRYMLLGLIHNTLDAICMILVISFFLGLLFVPVFLMVNHLIKEKTSDENFCPRIVSPEARIKYGCPPVKPIAKNYD